MKKVICSEHAPAAIGPYAQAIAANGIVFTSGQLPIDPATGAFPEGIAAQTKQSLTNVKAILAEESAPTRRLTEVHLKTHSFARAANWTTRFSSAITARWVSVP